MKNWNTEKYHKLLCDEMPEFLKKYISLPSMQRLEGVGLLCGTDWTPLFHNAFYYSRLSHSVGVALIIWNFTHDKKQTLAGLFHDISTRSFSHVIDFKNGDALKQESTEDLTCSMIRNDKKLQEFLKADGIKSEDVENYHLYPVADNDMPRLSADRLEYMYPSGAALDGSWKFSRVKKNYRHVILLKNEEDLDELGFDSEKSAFEYTERYIHVSLLLQKNEDKIAMQLLADIVSLGMEEGVLGEEDLFNKDENTLIHIFALHAEKNPGGKFERLFSTFSHMTKIEHTSKPLENAYCLSLKVKRRYVDPLFYDKKTGKVFRLSLVNKKAALMIKNFLSYEDTKYGCVRWC